jgi:signal transduction histidine kinase
LPPGRYELQARARRTRGEWGPIAGFALRIAPPWWQTWTFRAASALALLGLVALAFRWRERALRRRNAELANLVALRTRELEQAQERVVKLERDATEQQMAGGFAHEMRNVLTGAKVLLASVHSGSEESLCVENSSKLKDLFVLVKPHVPPDERPALIAAVRGIHANEKQLDTVLDDVDKALARGLATTRVLLDYARLGHERAGNEPVLLLPLVEAVIGESREDFSAHGIVVEIAIAPATTLPADEAHLYSILKNLVLNARDALVDNDGPRVLRIAFIEEAERRILRIEDTGVGIEPAHRARLFEPFFSTKARGGTGLGLGIVRKLVGLYGGTIAIESTVGDGTHLQITLPREGSGVRG